MIKREFKTRYSNCVLSTPPSEYRLGNIAKPIIFCVDCLFHVQSGFSGERCDEFVFFDIKRRDTGVYLIEQKTRPNGNLAKIGEQLQGGARFIEIFLKKDPALDRYKLYFMPVLVSKGIRPAYRDKLRNIKISLRGSKQPIQYVERNKKLPKLDA